MTCGHVYTEKYILCGCFESHPGPAEECFSTTLGGFGCFVNYMRGVKGLGLDTPLMTWDCHEWGTRAFVVYFHSQVLEVVVPSAAYSYPKAPQALLRRGRF